MKLLKRLMEWFMTAFWPAQDAPVKEAPNQSPPAGKPSFEGLMEHLAEVKRIARYRVTQAGRYANGQADLHKILGTYIDLNPLESYSEIYKSEPPSVMCVSLFDLGKVKARKCTLARFSAIKMDKSPATIERASGPVFEGCMTWATTPRTKRWGKQSSREIICFYIWFTFENGRAKLLKENGKPSPVLRYFAAMHNEPIDEKKARIEADIGRCFNSFLTREMNWLVTASKPGMKATFGIPPLTAPEIFHDRVKVKTESGRTSPIFHPVRPHERHTRKGTQKVRLHHRGARKFQWGGYLVNIQIPHEHTFMVNEFTVPGIKLPEEKRTGAIEIEDVARMLTSERESLSKTLRKNA